MRWMKHWMPLTTWRSTNPKYRRALKIICESFRIRQEKRDRDNLESGWCKSWIEKQRKVKLKGNLLLRIHSLVIGIILIKVHVWNPKSFLAACNFRKSCWWFLQFWSQIWGTEKLPGWTLTRVKWCLCPYKFGSSGRPWILLFHVVAIPDESKCRKCKLRCDYNREPEMQKPQLILYRKRHSWNLDTWGILSHQFRARNSDKLIGWFAGYV